MKNLWKALMMVRDSDPGSFWRRLLYQLLQSLLPLVGLYLLKLVVDSVQVGGDPAIFLGYLVAMCAVFLANRIVTALSGVNNDVLSQRLVDHVSDLLQHQSARLDMQYYDNPAYHDTLHRAQQEASYRPLQIVTNFSSLVGAVVSSLGVVVLLAAASWWVIVVMVVAVLPGFAVRLLKARRIYRFRRENTQLYRRTAYYSSLLTGRDYAKELRAFGLASLFRRRYVMARKGLSSRLLSISRRLGVLDIVCGVVEAAAMLAIVWLLASEAFAGAITIGSFVMLFEAFRRGQGYLSSLVGAISGLYDNRLFVSNLFEFLSLKPTILPPEEPQPVPQDIVEVEFRDVTFRYPDMGRDVLSHFSLTARRGMVTRIDGCNGYGKSTLIKLLLRLYDPQQGMVMINGIDIRCFNPAELRTRMGVLFQDFVRYNLTVEENIALGREADIADNLRLAGAQGFVEGLPQGKDTLLGRLFDGGSELSMGQWQRIALARALASRADILLLDEPTAWLDVDARAHFIHSLEKLKRDSIVLLVTHSQELQ